MVGRTMHMSDSVRDANTAGTHVLFYLHQRCVVCAMCVCDGQHHHPQSESFILQNGSINFILLQSRNKSMYAVVVVAASAVVVVSVFFITYLRTTACCAEQRVKHTPEHQSTVQTNMSSTPKLVQPAQATVPMGTVLAKHTITSHGVSSVCWMKEMHSSRGSGSRTCISTVCFACTYTLYPGQAYST